MESRQRQGFFFSPGKQHGSTMIVAIKARRFMSVSVAAALAGTTSGCSPVWEVGGAYFPAWLICMVAGLAGAMLARFVLVRAGLDPWIRPRALAYPAMGLFFTLATYLIFFSR